MSHAAHYWNNYYTTHTKLPEPSQFLVKMLPRLQKGKCLDIAMGAGQNAIELAKNGFTVRGFDISQTAIELARQQAQAKNVALEAKQTDLDLYLFELMAYDSLVMFNFKPPVKRYYAELTRTLKQGGTLLVESFTMHESHVAIGADESYRDCYFRPNELLNNLQGLRILFYSEDLQDGHHVVQCLAQKPLDKDVAKYNLFDMQSAGKKEAKDPNRERLEALFKK